MRVVRYCQPLSLSLNSDQIIGYRRENLVSIHHLKRGKAKKKAKAGVSSEPEKGEKTKRKAEEREECASSSSSYHFFFSPLSHSLYPRSFTLFFATSTHRYRGQNGFAEHCESYAAQASSAPFFSKN